MNDTFYEHKAPTKAKWKAILREAKELSFSHRCDVLDCKVSFCRRPTDKTQEEILAMMDCNKFLHLVFIHRRRTSGLGMEGRIEYLEAGLSVSPKDAVVDYFIFTYMDMEHLPHFIRKYKLRRHS